MKKDRHYTILIVDDNKNNIYTLSALLSTLNNINIHEAFSGHEALEIALTEPVDLILLDIQMPNMDGFEVAHLLKLKKKTKDIPIIFLTAFFKSDQFIEKGYKVGAIDYLTKPVDDNQLLNKVRMHQKLREKERELESLNSSLESKVAERTAELHRLNCNLEKRVREEIEKGRRKDKLMLEQSRHIEMAELLVNISHHWRQPIGAISTVAQDIQDAYRHNELDEEYLNNSVQAIMNEVEGLSKTITQFSMFFADEAEKVRFNVEQPVRKGVEIFSDYSGKHHLEVQVTTNDNCFVQGYPHEFAQVIYNMLKNVSDVSIQQGKNDAKVDIRIRKMPEGDKIRIEIEDNCGGIPEEYIDKIFNPYFTTSNKERGKGVGLFLSKTIIETKMHGSLRVENTFRGAKFIIEV